MNDALFALPFNLGRLEASGGPVPLLDGLQRSFDPATNTATAQYTVSDGGTLVHVTGAEERGPAVTKQRKRARTAKMIRELRRLGYRVELVPASSGSPA